MRKAGNKQNLLVFPLNFLLGQGEAAVRILRLLSAYTNTFLGIPEITEKTGLSNTGTRRTLDALEQSGILISPLSAKKAYSLRLHHPLYPVIIRLFKDEQVLFSTVKKEILAAFGGDNSEASSLWLDTEYFEPGRPIVIHFVAYSNRISEIIANASEALVALENRLDTSIDIIPHDRESYIDSPRNFELLSGLPPDTFSLNKKPAKKAPKSNEEQKEAALTKARKISQRIEKDPKLIVEALNRLNTQIENASPSTRQQLLKWQRLLKSGSVKRVLQTLCDNTPESERLRQSHPFAYLEIE